MTLALFYLPKSAKDVAKQERGSKAIIHTQQVLDAAFQFPTLISLVAFAGFLMTIFLPGPPTKEINGHVC